ncbi:MAG: hypothetical protein HOW73_39130 [Polyangiaceae bacterium]|nr:hypothetical protein [Polyangiaceae bacterium]
MTAKNGFLCAVTAHWRPDGNDLWTRASTASFRDDIRADALLHLVEHGDAKVPAFIIYQLESNVRPHWFDALVAMAECVSFNDSALRDRLTNALLRQLRNLAASDTEATWAGLRLLGSYLPHSRLPELHPFLFEPWPTGVRLATAQVLSRLLTPADAIHQSGSALAVRVSESAHALIDPQSALHDALLMYYVALLGALNAPSVVTIASKLGIRTLLARQTNRRLSEVRERLTTQSVTIESSSPLTQAITALS